MHYQDYYRILGVPRDATADAIRKAFRKLARKFHPDVSKEKDAETRMKEVNEAYAVLSDPEKRAAFDQLGKGHAPGEEFRPPPGWDAGFEHSDRGYYPPHGEADYSEFFSQLFGGFGRDRGGQAATGEDHRARIYLDLEDSFAGATRGIALRSPRLDQQGRVTLENRTLNVKIPKGVYEGQTIRLAGQGTPGAPGAQPGDLLLEVGFNPHPRLRPQGRDLHLTLPLAPWEAALGAVLGVGLPGGEIKVRIPEGAQSGQKLRVRGKGFPSNPPGDLLLDLKVVLPPADTPEARAAYEAMARAIPFNPRQEEG